MREYCLVYPVYTQDFTGERHFFLGRKAPGKFLSGYINGFGGKLENGEDIEECVRREVGEEIPGVKFDFNLLQEVGYFIDWEDKITCYILPVESRFELEDGPEMVDMEWVSEFEIEKVLPGCSPSSQLILPIILETQDTFAFCLFENRRLEVERKEAAE